MRDVLRDRIERSLGDVYRIERELGGGGMSRLYVAVDADGRRVALKALPPELTDPVSAERFRREVKMVGELRHPNVVPLIGSGEAPGLLYYVMPYVDGESLRARLQRDARLAAAEALGIAEDIARALEHAHLRGIVHRDVKPENILLANGRALVADFGIARAVGQAKGRLTGSGTSIGTPAYMSPEQASAEHRIDGRTDIYSLGCVLYEMLAGEPPFTGRNPQAVIAKRFAAPAPPLRDVHGAVASRVDPVVQRALAREPRDRYPTAGEFASALRACRTALTITSGAHPVVIVPPAPAARPAGLAALGSGAFRAIVRMVRRGIERGIERGRRAS